MLLQRRTLLLLGVLALIAAPAVALRAACAGRSCQVPQAPPKIPFCSLPAETRGWIAAGFREERSPDVLAVTGSEHVVGGTGLPASSPWPSVEDLQSARVPIVFWGSGVNPSAELPPGTGLRDVAPTLASLLGFRIPHPEVRSGRVVAGIASGKAPRLVLVVVWKHVGSQDLREATGRWPELSRLMSGGASTLNGVVGSLPLDPAAAVATLGTGGLPAEHGIIGTFMRDGNRVVRAWSRGAPVSIIATLTDDLDEQLRQRPLIGLVGTSRSDRGATGGNWYLGGDRDDILVVTDPAAQTSAATSLLRTGYGGDRVPDLLVVVMDASVPRMDAALARMVGAAQRASGGSVSVVVTATGSMGLAAQGAVSAPRLREEVERALSATGPVIEAVAPGGLFLGQGALVETGVTAEDVLRELRALPGPGGGRLFADAFPGIAVTLARYC